VILYFEKGQPLVSKLTCRTEHCACTPSQSFLNVGLGVAQELFTLRSSSSPVPFRLVLD
jgi:hypothetical protein